MREKECVVGSNAIRRQLFAIAKLRNEKTINSVQRTYNKAEHKWHFNKAHYRHIGRLQFINLYLPLKIHTNNIPFFLLSSSAHTLLSYFRNRVFHFAHFLCGYTCRFDDHEKVNGISIHRSHAVHFVCMFQSTMTKMQHSSVSV